MSLYLHTIKPPAGSKKDKKTIGRGGKRGTYSGRGQKGQRSRSGGRSGTLRRGIRQLVERTHKLPGFKSIHAKPEVISVGELGRKFKNGDIVSPTILAEMDLIQNTTKGVKVLANGEINVKIILEDCSVSASAKKAIEAAGGSVKNEVKEVKKPSRVKKEESKEESK